MAAWYVETKTKPAQPQLLLFEPHLFAEAPFGREVGRAIQFVSVTPESTKQRIVETAGPDLKS